MVNERVTGSEALMLALKDEGVTTLFGYPGGSIMPVYDALYDYTRGEKAAFEHILVRHEQAAVHAAEGFARVSGRVGVALVTSGPGATNTLTGVADAMLDSTPLVVIAGQVPTKALGTDAFQEVDLVGVAQPISKWSYQIRHAQDIAWAVSRAFYIARSGRPGPVVLDFPKNAQTELVEYTSKKVDFVRSYVERPPMDSASVERAAQLINNARKPLALVGQGVELGNAQQELMAFLEKADIPAGRTMLGLSALPSNHPLNVGMLGMHGNYAVNMKEQECDVLIAIGMRFSDRVTGNLKTFARQAKVIHLDIDRSEIDKNVKTDVAVVADCKESLPAITALLQRADHHEWRQSFAPLDEQERLTVIEPAIHPTQGPLLMGEVVNAVAEQAPDDTVLVTDVGQNQLFATRYFKYHHQRSICTSGGLGTMGYGMPAAIGAAKGAPQRTVCCFMGDGGFQMNLQELGTIMEQQVGVKLILLNNNYLGNVRQWQDMFWNKRKSFTKMMNPRYEQIASAYNIGYRAVLSREQLRQAIAQMLADDKPFILECAIMEEDNVLPMTPPGMSVDDMLLSLDGSAKPTKRQPQPSSSNTTTGMTTSHPSASKSAAAPSSLFTLLVYSENIAGILNQITAVFTRRQVNIESLNVSASSIPGVHKYTITVWSDEDQIAKITSQIEKKIDVVKASYFTDEQLFIRESGLYKLSTQAVMQNAEISRTIRRFDASIIEVNPTYVIVMKYGVTDEVIALYRALSEFGCVLQYTRSGRIAVTRGKQEQVSDFLEQRTKEHGDD